MTAAPTLRNMNCSIQHSAWTPAGSTWTWVKRQIEIELVQSLAYVMNLISFMILRKTPATLITALEPPENPTAGSESTCMKKMCEIPQGVFVDKRMNVYLLNQMRYFRKYLSRTRSRLPKS